MLFVYEIKTGELVQDVLRVNILLVFTKASTNVVCVRNKDR